MCAKTLTSWKYNFFLFMGLFTSVYTSSNLAGPRKKLHPSSRSWCHSHQHSVYMFCAWGWPHFYVGFFADTEAFLVKNARVKLCIQPSLINRKLLLEGCSPQSDFQDWSWQGNSLVNCGTQSCLSMMGDGECGKASSASSGLCSPGAPP